MTYLRWWLDIYITLRKRKNYKTVDIWLDLTMKKVEAYL